MRRGEILSLTWQPVDFLKSRLTVGASKTDAGRGRSIPLNPHVQKSLETWATSFPSRKPGHYVFPAERYGLAGNDREPHTHSIDPTKPWRASKTLGSRRRIRPMSSAAFM